MTKPLAVVISDIHFSLGNLQLASASLRGAKDKAEALDVPLIIAGDLNDTKAIIRAEVANEIISILSDSKVKIFILEGNHDKINEKGIGHGLNYLAPYATIIDKPTHLVPDSLYLLPYFTDIEQLEEEIRTIPKGSQLIMHQGFKGAWMGDYIQDKSSLDPEVVKDHFVISGHYHKHQTVATVTYIGSPYTISYGEANDGDKGFLVLNTDGTFTKVILELRKHIIVTRTVENVYDTVPNYKEGDKLWLKVSGPRSELKKIDKSKIPYQNFKLDLIADKEQVLEQSEANPTTDGQLLDKLIDNLNDTNKHKEFLKNVWRQCYDAR